MTSATNVTEKLRRWAAARERRNGPDGYGKTGTRLLYDAAEALAALEGDNETLRAALEEIATLHGDGPLGTHEGDIARAALREVQSS